MSGYEWKGYRMGYTVTHFDMLQIRIPDPWWRAPLVSAGLLRPKYRKATREDIQRNMSRNAAAQEAMAARMLATSEAIEENY